MSLADHYRVLGLRTGAAFGDVKTAYRRLARRYHPDVNPGNQQTKERFIQITQAYQILAEALAPEESWVSLQPVQASSQGTGTPEATTKQTEDFPKVQVNPRLSEVEQQLKEQSYVQLQALFQAKRFPRAIALVEGLAQRMPQDPEVRQWQSITYQRWGRQLIHQGQLQKAQLYLKKALRTDPHNKALGEAVQRDFQYLGQKQAELAQP